MALLRIRKPNGEIVEIASLPGKKGDDGKTPVKGVDYFTVEELAEIIAAANAYTDEKTSPANLESAVKSVGDGYYAKVEDLGDIETALDSIIVMQESLIGGDSV